MTVALSGCSYSYEVVASLEGGRVIFAVSPKSPQRPDCVRRIEVIPENGQTASWEESVDYEDDCANRFPLPYGATLKGHHQEGVQTAVAKPLQRGVIYQISTTTGATGYGGGRFVIQSDGHVVNLPYRDSKLAAENGS